MEKAERALASARLLLVEGDPDGACNRAYYAMFHAGHAALWSTGAEQPGTVIKTHNGFLALFGRELVKGGKIDAAHGRALGRVQKRRTIADYTAEAPTETDAEDAIALATAFVSAMADIVKNGSI